MCAQTRPRCILSSEGVLGGMEFEPMLTPREKSPLPENVPRGGSNPRHRGQRAHALPTELFRPPQIIIIITIILIKKNYNNNNNNNHNDNNNNNSIGRRNSRCFTISSLRREQSPSRTLKLPGLNRVQVTCNTSTAYHVLLSLTGFKRIWRGGGGGGGFFVLFFFGYTIHRRKRGGNRSTQRKPLAMSFRKCHLLKPEDSSPKRDSNPHDSIGGSLGKQTC